MTINEIRKRFESSNDFNEIFEAFESALAQRIDDLDLYRKLFWNPILSADEIGLFGEKLAADFPPIAYDVYMWLANVFEVIHSRDDNFEHTIEYYRKAAAARPAQIEPYLNAANCYDPDLSIPALPHLIDFLKQGSRTVANPSPLIERLVQLYELSGNDEMSAYYRRMIEQQPPAPEAPPPPAQ